MAFALHSRIPAAARFILPLLWFFIGCDESLPPRLPDPNPLVVDVSVTNRLVNVEGGVVVGDGGMIEVSVLNVYSDVLQDSAAVNIECQIWLADAPDSMGRLTISASSLSNPALLSRGILTLLPRGAAYFDKQWDYTTEAGTPFWNLIPLHAMYDSQGEYLLSSPVEMIMMLKVRVFKPVPEYTLGPRSFTMQFKVR